MESKYVIIIPLPKRGCPRLRSINFPIEELEAYLRASKENRIDCVKKSIIIKILMPDLRMNR